MKMKKHLWGTYGTWVLFTEAVGGLAGWLTRDGTQLYSQVITKPPLSPPSIVFPIVWVILFALMGIGAARVYLAPPSGLRSRSLLLFLVPLASFGASFSFSSRISALPLSGWQCFGP